MSIRRGDRVRHVPTGVEGMVVRLDGADVLVLLLQVPACRAEWFPAAELELRDGPAPRPRLRDVSASEKGEVRNG